MWLDDTRYICLQSHSEKLYDRRSALFPPVSSVINWRFFFFLLMDFSCIWSTWANSSDDSIGVFMPSSGLCHHRASCQPSSVFSPAGSPSLWFIFLFFPFLSFFLSFFFFFFLQLASHRSVIISVRSVEQKSRIKYILIRVWSFYLWVCDSDRKKNKESVFNSGQNKE